MRKFLKLLVSKQMLIRGAILLALLGLGYVVFFGTLTFSPATEAEQMNLLTDTKAQYPLDEFVTDGCSGNVSAGWKGVTAELSKVSERFADTYQDVATVPFEAACITHDRAYHTGEGGYVGRLRADNQLRTQIIEYGIEHAQDIKDRAKLGTEAEAVFLYETIAGAVYRAVRIGGAPCTGELYAWGYGYNQGSCTSE